MRIFLDANILFSAAYRADSRLQDLWQLTDVKLISSNYAYNEAYRNLNEPTQLSRLDKLHHSLEIIDHENTLLPKNISLRDKDKPILAAAIQARANFLLTGDSRDFGQFFGKSINGVTILLPATFLATMTTATTE